MIRKLLSFEKLLEMLDKVGTLCFDGMDLPVFYLEMVLLKGLMMITTVLLKHPNYYLNI